LSIFFFITAVVIKNIPSAGFLTIRKYYVKRLNIIINMTTAIDFFIKKVSNLMMILDKAKEVLKTEAEGILELADRLDENFTAIVDLIFNSRGRLIVSGIGKSGIIGRKIAATLNSTGTSALFLHPVEAMHGDLGQVGADDIFLALSNSGETNELKTLLPAIRDIGCKIIAFAGNKTSSLVKLCDIVVDVSVDSEACPLGLSPTTSTTVLLAMGDALAVVLLEKKNFKASDFKKLHPGGTLGQRLTGSVGDIMLSDNRLPMVAEKTPMEEAIKAVDAGGLGATMVVNTNLGLAGIITDGDIRRMVAAKNSISALMVENVMTRNPRHIRPDAPAYDALYMMEKNQITVLPVVDAQGKVCGILHLHDILGKGEFKFNATGIEADNER
jgi:arabinose-5-phosphate isomerase